jgi:hypothetical protein
VTDRAGPDYAEILTVLEEEFTRLVSEVMASRAIAEDRERGSFNVSWDGLTGEHPALTGLPGMRDLCYRAFLDGYGNGMVAGIAEVKTRLRELAGDGEGA